MTLPIVHPIVAGLFFVVLALAGPGQAQASERVLFQLDGFDYTESDLSPELRQLLYKVDSEHYQKMGQLIDAALFDIFLEKEAERLGKGKEEVKKEYLAFSKPHEETVRKFYETNKERIHSPYKQVRDQIVRLLITQQIETKKSELVAKWKEKSDFEVLLPKPEAPFVNIASDGFPSQGSAKAPVTVVEFADYQCPHCKTASSVLKRLTHRYKDRVKLVYMDLPIDRSGVSRTVAQGAVCADQQGKFWAYHDLAFERQEDLSNDSPLVLAKALGLDQKAFQSCLESPETIAKVRRSEDEARRLGINSTPTIFVNGKQVHVYDWETDLTQAVEKALKDTKS